MIDETKIAEVSSFNANIGDNAFGYLVSAPELSDERYRS